MKKNLFKMLFSLELCESFVNIWNVNVCVHWILQFSTQNTYKYTFDCIIIHWNFRVLDSREIICQIYVLRVEMENLELVQCIESTCLLQHNKILYQCRLYYLLLFFAHIICFTKLFFPFCSRCGMKSEMHIQQIKVLR